MKIPTLFLILFQLALIQYGQSLVVDSFDNSLFFHWKGNLTFNSITLKIFKNNGVSTLEAKPFLLLYQKNESEYFGLRKFWMSFEDNLATISIDSLLPNNTYCYLFLVSNDGPSIENMAAYLEGIESREYSFTTFGAPFKPYSFNFSAGSCAQSASNHQVFRVIANQTPQFFVHLGDLHYDDITENNVNAFYMAFYKSFLSNSQRELYMNIPLTYVWDDHDFGGNDCEGDSVTKQAAMTAYKKFVPNYLNQYPLPITSRRIYEKFLSSKENSLLRKIFNRSLKQRVDDDGIYHSFIVGRTFFVVLDETSHRILKTEDLLGKEQRIWLENQLYYASTRSEIKVVFLMSPLSWNSWAFLKFKKSRFFITSLVKKYLYPAGKEVYMIAGDAHMIGLDDGSNNYLAGFPTIQAGSLDSRPNCKGGPYSHGYFPGKGQYSLIQVEDDGTKVCLKIHLKRMEETMIYYDTCNKTEGFEQPSSCD